MKTKTQRVVTAAMFASLACVVTMIIKIPSPLKGYLNLGDCIVLLTGWMLTPFYAFFAAGIGSALADLFLGYTIYAPVTFIIKGVMAIVAAFGYRFLRKRMGEVVSRIVSGAAAQAVMVLGYFLYEFCLYGISTAVINVPGSIMQGLAGLVAGLVLIRIFVKNKIIM